MHLPAAGKTKKVALVDCMRKLLTIPSAMYTLIQTPGGESGAARLCIISIALAMISLLISEWLARISRERAGR